MTHDSCQIKCGLYVEVYTSHRNEDAYCDILRCDTVQSVRRGPTFRSNILPPFSHFIAGGYESTTTHCGLCSSVSVVWVARPENLHSISGGDGDFCRHFLQTDFEARTVSCPAGTGVSIMKCFVMGS